MWEFESPLKNFEYESLKSWEWYGKGTQMSYGAVEDLAEYLEEYFSRKSSKDHLGWDVKVHISAKLS